MVKYVFEWDNKKLKINLSKHNNIHFEEAGTVFKDVNALTVFDSEHSEYEERWFTLGFSSKGKLLVVNHTYRQVSDTKVIIRIFSARKADGREQKQYNEGI